MLIRPRDAAHVLEILKKAHKDMEVYANDHAESHYFNFWNGMGVLLHSKIFMQVPTIVQKNIMSQILFNMACPVLEKVLRSPEQFETSTKEMMKHKKYSKRLADSQAFFEDLNQKSLYCTKRQDIDETLMYLAVGSQETLCDKNVQQAATLCYIQNKPFRYIIKLLKKRLHSTYVSSSSFSSSEMFVSSELESMINSS